MISKAISRYIRISPRKTRLVADLVRGKPIDEAQAILMNVNKKATLYIKETLNSAVSNATRNPEISPSDLYISKITIDGGPMFKRYKAGSMGRAMMIRHRTSHILVELDVKKRPVVAPVVAKKGPGARVQGPEKEKKPKVEKRETKAKVKKEATAKKGK